MWRCHGTPLVGPLARGVLDGVRVAVKDLFAVAGFAVGAGNPAWLAEASVETADAAAVHALRAAGASISGIAQTDELAFSLSGTNVHYGTPPNAAAPGRVTGGSTSGPAAAVAGGAADVGLGTDTAGSIRVPAAVCGLYGLRPTHGVVSTDGVLGLAPSFDTVGWLAADAHVLALVGTVLLPPAQTRPPARVHCADAAIAGLLTLLGYEATVGSLIASDDLDALLAAFRTVQAAEAWQEHGRWIDGHPGCLAADVEERFRFGSAVSPASVQAARAEIAERRESLLAALGDDWIALPAAGGPGHARTATAAECAAWRQATLRRTVLASAFGLPSCVLPRRTSPPEGVALVGPPGSDHALLDAARAYALIGAGA